jgi:hypothetical protein
MRTYQFILYLLNVKTLMKLNYEKTLSNFLIVCVD